MRKKVEIPPQIRELILNIKDNSVYRKELFREIGLQSIEWIPVIKLYPLLHAVLKGHDLRKNDVCKVSAGLSLAFAGFFDFGFCKQLLCRFGYITVESNDDEVIMMISAFFSLLVRFNMRQKRIDFSSIRI